MSRLPALLAAFGIGALSAPAFAGCAHGADGTDYCGPDLIQLLYVTTTGAVYVLPTGPLSPLPTGFACAPVGGMYLLLSPLAPNFKQLYATLLSARLSGAPVTIAMDARQPQCTIAYVTL